jgi:molybdate transport system substrate-binding protein
LKAAALGLLFAFAAVAPAAAQTVNGRITLYAAGSLRGALTDIVSEFTEETTVAVDPTYGSSGLLRARIESGEGADVFASADTASPAQLQREGKSGAVTIFTRNRMCLLVKSALATRAPADLMLDPAVRLITSTPKADPAGDYAEDIFAKLDARRPGSLAALDAKALRLIGGSDAVTIPAGADAGAYLLLTADRGDAFLAYCSGFVAAARANPSQLRLIELPAALSVTANYGLVLRNNPPAAAVQLRDFILSAAGQGILARYGFSRL